MHVLPLRLPSRRAAITCCLALPLAGSPFAHSAGFADEAGAIRRLVADKILPYWHDTTIDREQGGYILADDAVKGRSRPGEKQLVSQAREVWAFSLAHRSGFSTPERDYLEAAAHGARFLRERMRDQQHGGYFWSVGIDGQPRDPRKILYGEAFVIYALVEFHRAGGGNEALDDALALYRGIQKHAHDGKHGGWTEHFERDWTPLPPRDPSALVEVAGYKSANTHLHLMEAFAELYAATKDPRVKDSLVEALELNQKYFYPPDASKSAFHFQPDWTPVTDPRSAGLSYGHNIEFAWLMIRAEEVLGRTPSWDHFFKHLDHTLRHGTDHQRGGIYNRGTGNRAADDTDKIWWVQAEGIAALTDALHRSPLKNQADEADTKARASYALALQQLLAFTSAHMTDHKTGVWLDTVRADGTPKATGLAHNWKANYHDLRAFLKFIKAFEHH